MNSILPRIAQGDDRAVHDCVDEYGDLVWRLARRYLNRADGEVEDAVQEVFVELWLAAPRFDPASGSEPAFVATLAHRRLTDYQRRVTARRKYEARARSESEPAILKDATAEREEVRRVAAEFDGLPEEERRALWMSLYQGLTQHQISEATDAPIGTVKSRLRRAMIRLCGSLDRDSHAMDREGVER